MNRNPRPELRALETAPASPPAYGSYDRGSMSPVVSLAAVPTVNPEPAYIAASAASQIVTSEYQSQHPDWDGENSSPFINEIALVSPASLSLINAFLDRLLFNFLASARSTSLASLRPAVTEVLKPRLAKEAIAGADEELQEFLGGGDEDELEDFHNGQEPPDEWDLELVWKRTRLRCMVFTRLGDMEEDDEDSYIEQEHLDNPTALRRLSRDIGIVSPAVAIFLTSILEFIGEHALMIAGEAAYKRCETRYRNERRRSQASQRVIVEEPDMEKVALNPTLGRLWRSWRKLLRSPRASVSRIMSRETVSHKGLAGFSTSRSNSRQSSVGTADAMCMHSSLNRTPSLAEILSRADPASIPLPLTDYDVAEIEVPGYSPSAVPKSNEGELQQRSLSQLGHADLGRECRSSERTCDDTSVSARKPNSRNLRIDTSHPTSNRNARSQSLPTPAKTTFVKSYYTQEPGQPPVGTSSAREDTHQESSVASAKVLQSSTAPSSEFDSREGGEVVSSIPGPTSATPTPFQLSVLNAISRHAARELQAPSGTNSDEESQEDQPVEGEHMGRPEVKESGTGGSSKYLIASLAKPREDAQTRYSTSSSVRTQTIGDVSPMEPAFIESGEVSPIEPSEDEDAVYQPRAATMGLMRRISDHGRLLDSNSEKSQTVRRQLSQDSESLDEPANAHVFHGRQRGVDGPSEDDYAKDEKREAFVVPEEFTSPKRKRDSDLSMLSGKDLQTDGTILNRRARLPGPEGGAPTLTPLREMVEAAQDTSDEASFVESSHVSRNQHSSSSARSALQGISNQPYPMMAAGGDKLSDLRRQLPSVYTGALGAGTDRAAVQRVAPSPGEAREPVSPQGRSSDGSIRDLRSAYAATSNTSPSSVRVKARAGSYSADPAVGPVKSRTSSDGSKNVYEGRYRAGSAVSGDKERDFEELINSDETIQYTLTPQNMREIEGPESPRANSYQSSAKTAQMASMIRSGRTSAEQSRPAAGRSHGPSVSKEVKRTLESNVGNFPASQGPTFIIHSGPPVKRGPQAQARDARVENEDTRDFADFIRSTGPEQPKSLPKTPGYNSSRPTTAINGSRPHRTSVSTSPRTLQKSPPGVNPIIAPLISENKASKKGGTRLQARDATISRNDETSDLIDFIRQGPPAQNNGIHIPRSVATLKNKADSDSMPNSYQGKARDTNSVASTQESTISKSLHSSVNSRTGLLDSSNRQNPQPFTLASTEKRPSRFNEPPQPPTRKQRRVRDPYAIDDDSDSDDEALHTPRPEPQEESLLDFLNSTPPPEASLTPPPIDIRPTGKGLQRKTSASMRSRFTRNSSSSASTKPSATKPNLQPKTSTSTPSGSYRGSTNGGPISTPRIQEEAAPQVQQSRSETNNYRVNLPTNEGRLSHPRNGTSKPVARPIEARGATQADSVRDLADFLKNSGPPEPPVNAMISGSGYGGSRTNLREEGGGFARMFSRRKRSAGMA